MPFKSLRDDVVLVDQEVNEEKIGSIVIPGKKKMLQGTVIKTGPGKRLDNGKIRPMSVKEGDKVIWGEWAGQKAELNGKEYLIILEADIIGILDSE